MSFDWNEYLQLARQLGGMAGGAARRSSVSRAYYCAFHAASLALKANKVVMNPRYERDRHLRVWNIYIDSAKKDCRRIGNTGQRLKLVRQEADYEPDGNFSDVRVQRCITEAATLVADVGANVPESFSTAARPNRVISFLRRFF
jgi:uncharacterized protein (UPF0332 family)